MSSTATALSSLMTGRAVGPGDPGWDAARQAFNVLIDQRPEAVVLPADERDVATAIRFAREHVPL